MLTTPDRLQTLIEQDPPKVTGIDFVFVRPDQQTLEVYFHKPPSAVGISNGDIEPKEIRISTRSDDGLPSEIAVTDVSLIPEDLTSGRPEHLLVNTALPGGYSQYLLHIDHLAVDRYFKDVAFSFKAHCPSDVDCLPKPHECPPEKEIDFPVDYQARDFWSLRRALLEFAAQRYPDWQDRGREADFGVMLAEVMSALGDELAYYQDRVAREAYLETATQRRSLRRHARLVDYPVHDGLAAQTWLDVTVKEGMSGSIPAGFDVWAMPDHGARIDFEVGHNLREMLEDEYDPEVLEGNKLKGKKYSVNSSRNRFEPHIWDEDDTCLPVGKTELFIKGHHADDLPFDDFPENGSPGRWVLLKTTPQNPAIPARAWMVRVILVKDKDEDGNRLVDSLICDPDTDKPTPLTRLVWEEEQSLPFEMDLETLEVRGNLIPVVAGRTEWKRFVIGELPENSTIPQQERRELGSAIEREGPKVDISLKEETFDSDNGRWVSRVEYDSPCGRNRDQWCGSVAYLFSLPGTDEEGLVSIGDDVRASRPEVSLVEETFDQDKDRWVSDVNFESPCERNRNEWCWRRSLLGVRSSQPLDKDFALDDGYWGRVVGYQRVGEEWVHLDYKSDAGKTIRFGDGQFGRVPTEGTVFKATYRLGNGRRGNVAGDTLTFFNPEDDVLDAAGLLAKAGTLIESISNPLPAQSGTDPETPDEIRQLAPEAFRSVSYRAVTERDYGEAAERLPWVQRAGGAFRWTGSWFSAFVTPDPRGAVVVTKPQRLELAQQLDRFRQAGREVHVLDPRYADLDLEITICVEPSAYRAQVKERVLETLLGRRGLRPQRGFFSPDNFTFGTPLERSVLEAAIQRVPGVRAVDGIRIARRGWFDKRDFT